MKFLIVNADDFGYSQGVNQGVIEAHKSGIVTSTSVLVDASAADEAKNLIQFKDLSIGLHFELLEVQNISAELDRQVEKFQSIVGRKPDHIDTHKRHTTDEGIKEVLMNYAETHQTPIRQLGYAKLIDDFGVNSGDASVDQLKRTIDEVTEGYNELMCHVGYADEYLRGRSSYSLPRETELASICDQDIRNYLEERQIKLISWRQVR